MFCIIFPAWMHDMLLQQCPNGKLPQVHLKAALISSTKERKDVLLLWEREGQKEWEGQRLTRHFQVSNEVAN